ncbi:RHS repeat-associated core domain-containing protein [Actinoplanes sp. M2I2]|uniref:RHS repeat-associated core domain-containing protein n=1 Tax=Actinoplanes sp. M2I2 TaxID=1734444 RepID=UPI0035B118C1
MGSAGQRDRGADGAGYDPYGAVLSSTGVRDEHNPFRFTGAYQDAFYDLGTNFTKLGRRWYHAEHGRFAQQDLLTFLNSPARGNRYANGANPSAWPHCKGSSRFPGCPGFTAHQATFVPVGVIVSTRSDVSRRIFRVDGFHRDNASHEYPAVSTATAAGIPRRAEPLPKCSGGRAGVMSWDSMGQAPSGRCPGWSLMITSGSDVASASSTGRPGRRHPGRQANWTKPPTLSSSLGSS